jgi:peptide/nickel transport system substrate-binding protein
MFCVALFAPAARDGVANAAAQDEITMTVGTLQDPGTLNPFSMTLSMSYTISFLMYDTLNSVEPDLSSGSQLAASWEHDDTGMVWTYYLVQDAYWHDDEQVTAEDVAFTFNLILDNRDTCALWIDYLSNVTLVEAVDEYTVRITTEVPKATMLSINIPILPEHIWSLIPVDKLDTVDYWNALYFPNGPVGSGPFILDEYVKDDFIRMLTNTNYHIDVADFDILLYKVYTDDTSMINALNSGELTVATGVPTDAWDATLAGTDIDGQAVKALSLFELGVNCMPEDLRENFNQASDNLEMNNPAVRQAIAMCVNKNYIVTTILSGLAEEGSSLIPTATDQWHYDVPAEEVWEYDLDAANLLLDSAGYTADEDGDGIRENDTTGVELDLIFYYRNDVTVADQLAAEEIYNSLLEVGIRAEPQGITESTLYTYWYQARYDLYIWAWDTDVDPSFMLSVMTTDQIPDDPQDWTAWSDCFYSNPYYDQLFIDQQNAVDFEDRQAIIFEMQQILYRDCPYIVLWYPYGLYAYRTDVFYNYPDMVANPGMTPGSMWFFFEVMVIGENTAPYDVYAGEDSTVIVGTEMSFVGAASDVETPTELTYEWTFVEPDLTESTLTGETVDYLFENVGDVTVTLTVSDPDGLQSSDELVVTVVEAPENSGWINGYVRDADSQPLESASVTNGVYTVTSNETGFYNLTAVEGSYTVNASLTGFGLASADVDVVAGQTVWQNFTLSASVGSVEGHIYDAVTGDPVAGASVKLVDTTKLVLTDDEGYYSLEQLAPGSYTLNVSKSGYLSNETEIDIVAGEATVQDMNLETEAPGDDDDGGGISGTTLAIIGLLVVVVVAAAVALMLMRRKKAAGPPEPPPT